MRAVAFAPYINHMRRLIVLLVAVYLFIYVWSVPMLMLSLVPTWGTWMGGFLLILQGTLLALWLAVNAGRRGVVAALLIAVLSFGIEYIGVTTGWPFGRYTYTDVLGIKVGGAVPLPIPFAWLLVVPAAVGAAGALLPGHVSRWWIVLLAPILALGLDLLLEPVAAYVVGYWQWIEGGPYYGVPTANFIAWGATALALTALMLLLAGRQLRAAPFLPALPALLYVLSLLQFTLVDLAHGYPLAALIGGSILLGSLVRLRATLRLLWQTRWLGVGGALRHYLLSRPD
ncbi:MAG: carotenoid biosynthesis protein [Chloroflexota bacterium]|nr:carotenoid biosynthesis protein [Chloroflexota bacterium]